MCLHVFPADTLIPTFTAFTACSESRTYLTGKGQRRTNKTQQKVKARAETFILRLFDLNGGAGVCVCEC